MIRFVIFAWLLAAPACAQWQMLDGSDWPQPIPDLFYAQRVVAQGERTILAHIAGFATHAYRLEVIEQPTDNIGGWTASGATWLATALREAGCVAGVNGGFFHPDGTPLGLVIAQGQRSGRIEHSRLLSGVLYSDAQGTYLMRRAQFEEHPKIMALLQSGPYLVDGGNAVRGLSAQNASRRTFLATDWRGHWVLGATETPLTLAELAQLLTTPELLTPWRVERAINLDGGTSTGFFFDQADEQAPVILAPWKRVSNLLGIIAR